LARAETRVKWPVPLPDFNQNWNVSTNFGKKFAMPNFMEIRSVVTCVCTDMGKPTSRISGIVRYKYGPPRREKQDVEKNEGHIKITFVAVKA
jgi:hypothetical protein